MAHWGASGSHTCLDHGVQLIPRLPGDSRTSFTMIEGLRAVVDVGGDRLQDAHEISKLRVLSEDDKEFVQAMCQTATLLEYVRQNTDSMFGWTWRSSRISAKLLRPWSTTCPKEEVSLALLPASGTEATAAPQPEAPAYCARRATKRA